MATFVCSFKEVDELSKKKKWIIWTVVIVLITNVLTFYGSRLISLYLPNGDVLISRQDYNDIMKFQKMYTVRDRLYEYYDGKIDDNTLVDGAIKGMTSSLNDPYTVYMDTKDYSDFSEQTQGNYSGVGLQVSAVDNNIVVSGVFDGSPAQKAGILAKDEIVKVNGQAVSGKDLDKAVSLMKGPEGTDVTVTFYRTDTGNFDKTMKRSKINMVTVKGEMLAGTNKIGYIQVSMFDENTAANFQKALQNLKDQGMKGLIIDLRDNPGGLLDQCVDMVSNFVPKDKVIVSTIDKYKKETKYNSKGGIEVGIPLVLLVNGNSASASEIFSGAIKDYKAGTLIGTKTFGKGIVQTILDSKLAGFGDGTALKVTVSKYYTPSGVNIQGTGIQPDVAVDYPEALTKQPYSRSTDPQFSKALEVINQKVQK